LAGATSEIQVTLACPEAGDVANRTRSEPSIDAGPKPGDDGQALVLGPNPTKE